VFDKSDDSVWHFAGDWKEICADLIETVGAYRAGPPAAGVVQRYSFVTFHQSYGYEEFVEGLRPVLNGDPEGGEIQYEIRSGVFKDLCRRARSAPDQRFAMVIDEINRGNISKIFGELITLIEPDKREDAENAISVTLPYSGESFSVPTNVDIIGTMNTADRSLALLDTALRRRFEFVPVMPDARDEPGAPLAGLRVRSGEQVIDIPRMLSAINQRVEALYDRDHCIGHAYFTPLAKVPDGDERLVALQQVFSTRIVPLLEEYFFEDWQKIRFVLADNQKAVAAQFVRESADHEDDLARLFGSDHGLDSYSTKRRYAVQDAAFSNPDAYIGIYQTLTA
jgi:5-methylcytosine-specific restriction protein B